MKYLFKKDLLKNKFLSIFLIITAVVSVIVLQDATVFILLLCIGIPLFFSKENCIGICERIDSEVDTNTRINSSLEDDIRRIYIKETNSNRRFL